METSPTQPTPAVPIVRDERICCILPVYGKLDAPFVQSLLGTLSSTNVIAYVNFRIGDSLISRSRNVIANTFLEGVPTLNEKGERVIVQYDWMLFIDTDLVFNADAVPQLYELARKRGPGVYCGTYPLKQLKPKIVMNNLPGCVPDADGVVKVREAGTGFMLIHREVYAKLVEKFGDAMRYKTDMGESQEAQTIAYDFFRVGVRMDPSLGYRRFLSEDWYFCQDVRECGYDILMLTRIQCGHIGTFQFPGDPKTVVEAGDFIKGAMERLTKQLPPNVVNGAESPLVRTVKRAA